MTRIEKRDAQIKTANRETRILKLAYFPARSPLPGAALPSMSLIASAPFTNLHQWMPKDSSLMQFVQFVSSSVLSVRSVV